MSALGTLYIYSPSGGRAENLLSFFSPQMRDTLICAEAERRNGEFYEVIKQIFIY